MRISTRVVLDLESGQVLERDSYEYSGPLALCIKAATQAAQSGVNQANATAANYGGQAAGIGGTLVPALTKESTNPTGFNPNDLNSMLVAGEQGAGGANAGLTGQANLQASRTNNSGALSGVLDQAARAKTQTLSNNALGVQNENAQLKQKQQQAGLQGLQGLYGTDVGAQLKAQGLVPEDINAWANADKTGWLQDTTGMLGALGSLGMGAGAVGLKAPGAGCWIAAEVYGGWDDPRVDLVRNWIFNVWAAESWIGWGVSRLYLRVGQPVAWLLQHSDWLKRGFRRLFDVALRKGTI
jgi:hypothetical protein